MRLWDNGKNIHIRVPRDTRQPVMFVSVAFNLKAILCRHEPRWAGILAIGKWLSFAYFSQALQSIIVHVDQSVHEGCFCNGTFFTIAHVSHHTNIKMNPYTCVLIIILKILLTYMYISYPGSPCSACSSS